MNTPSRVALVTLLALSLGACSWLPKPKTEIETHKPIAIPTEIDPAPMDLKEVHWKVYSVEELKAVVAQMEATGQKDAVFYVLPKEEYDALAFNIAEMKRYIEDQKATKEFLVEAIKINNGEKTK